MTDPSDEYPVEIDCPSVKSLIDQGEDFLLLDCRQPEEHAIVHLEEAKLIPTDQLLQRVDELSDYRERRVVVHCHLGGRSLQVAEWLRGLGFRGAQNMTGGIDAWAVQVDPRLPRY